MMSPGLTENPDHRVTTEPIHERVEIFMEGEKVAELYNVKHGSSIFRNAAWSFRKPHEDLLEIKNMVCFYPEKVQLIRITG
jgi:uncharacterized protein (DUF427 family)